MYAIRSYYEMITPAFIEELDNDLSLGKGFDAVFGITLKLKRISETSPLSVNQSEKLKTELKKIDTVLNVIYPS